MAAYLVPLSLALLLLGAQNVQGDIYMHNPRGSNNKLNVQSNNRNNANRLFDSQNNDNGGYQVGDNCQPVCQNANQQYDSQKPGAGKGTMYYYAGSELSLEWTNQHACAPENLGPNTRCDIIIQYACDATPADNSTLRDGTKTTTITATSEGDVDPSFGRHESFQYYSDCKARQRNRGLFTADRNMRDDIGATSTRQNENGNRFGFECPEERDYYPYWHPTMWYDAAVLTSDTTRCSYYVRESENVKGRGFCSLPQYNNQAACEGGTAGGTWAQTSPRNVAPPYCGPVQISRDNHLGDVVGGSMASYNWTLPNPPPGLTAATCVLRIRYNITTTDFTAWPVGRLDGVDSRNNNDRSPVTNNPEKDYLGLGYNKTGPLRLAMNTAQFGRTFEDRSHVWVLKSRPADVDDDTRIINVNVRGRRGNIVQVYPSVEYDFVPTRFHAGVGDLLHIQWTGSDANSQGNNGNGRTSTDRSNLVQIAAAAANVPLSAAANTLLLARNGSADPAALARFAYLNQTGCDAGETDQNALDNCKVLNAAPAYFDGGLVELRAQGTMHFMSTRNNAFSNRSQKMTIIVGPGKPKPNLPAIIIGSVVGFLVIVTGVFLLAAFWVGAEAGGGVGLGSAIIVARTKRRLFFWRRPPVHSLVTSAAAPDSPGAVTPGPHGMVLAVPTPPDTPVRKGAMGGLAGHSGPYNPLVTWWVNMGRGNRFLGIYGTLTVAAALDGFISNVSHLYGSAGAFFPLAKAGGYMLDFNCTLILFPMMRNIMSWLRTTPLSEWVPLDEHITFHTLVAAVIAFASAFHIAMHYAAAAQMGVLRHYVIETLPGVTGHLIVLLMIPMFLTAHNSIRRGKGFTLKKRKIGGYDLFFNVHQLYILVFILLWIHSPSFHKWSFWPVVLFIVDKLVGHLRSGREVRLLRACNETTGTDVMRIEMAIDRFHYKPGQYLYINCPAISKHEWHPFTITSAPEEAIVSVHMRTRGDWTTGLRQLLNPENLKEVDFSDLAALSRASAPATSATRAKPLSPLAPASARIPKTPDIADAKKPAAKAAAEPVKKKETPPAKTSFFGGRGAKPRAKPELGKGEKDSEGSPRVEASQATPASVQALSKIAAQKEENGVPTGQGELPGTNPSGVPLEQVVSGERPAGGVAAAAATPLARADAISRAPLIRVDGPYGAGSEHVVDYDTVMLVGAGIGVTPFAAVLKSIRLRWRRQAATGGPLETVFPLKVYFYWICRDRQEFNWFSWLLAELEHEDVRLSNRFEINTYMTGELNLDEVVTQNKDTSAKKGAEVAWAGKKWAGRPNWKRIFKKVAETHAGKTVGVFLCGPGAQELRDACKSNTTLGGATFDFHKENF